ncbi:MAG: hypothetical protein HYY10_03020 [Candidatus Liptonbacteria bacterium]|nr:hypothetical protein [Candidatus Liptonbacteria bacterium]
MIRWLIAHAMLVIIALVAVDVFVWTGVLQGTPQITSSLHFLDVGQGDSELLLLPGNVAMLTDSGPDKTVVRSIARVLPAGRHYIDIGIISHPQLDHYGGFRELLTHYRFGAIVTNGREAASAKGEWNALMEALRAEHIPIVALRGGDRIRYDEAVIQFLAPDEKLLRSNELNDTGLVEYIATPAFSALLTADIGTDVEKMLLKKDIPLMADILKVGHHGSKYSTGSAFLARARPLLAAIGVGARNSYRHPTVETLARLASSTVRAVLRTDQHGTISIIPQEGKLRVFTER